MISINNNQNLYLYKKIIIKLIFRLINYNWNFKKYKK